MRKEKKNYIQKMLKLKIFQFKKDHKKENLEY